MPSELAHLGQVFFSLAVYAIYGTDAVSGTAGSAKR